MRVLVPAALAAAFVVAAGCSTSKTDPPGERRAFAQVMKGTAFADLDAARPGSSAEIESAPGWAVFSTIGAKAFLGGADGGLGLAHDGRTGAETYMRMSEPSFGFGLGSEQFRAVFVFRDAKTFHRFVDKGWDFRAGEPPPEIEVFRLADGRVAPDPALSGTKFWKDRDLN